MPAAPQSRKTFRVMVIAFAGLIVLAAILMLQFSERWRTEPDRPTVSDAIIVLAGEPSRARYAADLYLQRYAPVVLLIRPAERAIPPEEQVNRGILVSSGVPDGSVFTFSRGAENTLAEAQVCAAELPASVGSVLVVTSHTHVRRARMIFSDLLGARGMRVTVVATPGMGDDVPWWSSVASAMRNSKELAKALLYSLGVRFPSPFAQFQVLAWI